MKRAEDGDIPCLLMSCDVRASRWSTDTGWTVLFACFPISFVSLLRTSWTGIVQKLHQVGGSISYTFIQKAEAETERSVG